MITTHIDHYYQLFKNQNTQIIKFIVQSFYLYNVIMLENKLLIGRYFIILRFNKLIYINYYTTNNIIKLY